MRSCRWSASSFALCLLAAACSSSTAAPGNTPDGSAASDAQGGDAGSAQGDTGATETGSASDGGVGGTGSLAGTYGTAPIEPIVAAYWIGLPGNANETGGGPFVYLFSGPVACADISAASGWVNQHPGRHAGHRAAHRHDDPRHPGAGGGARGSQRARGQLRRGGLDRRDARHLGQRDAHRVHEGLRGRRHGGRHVPRGQRQGDLSRRVVRHGTGVLGEAYGRGHGGSSRSCLCRSRYSCPSLKPSAAAVLP